MIPPVILPDQIIDEAIRWRDEYRRVKVSADRFTPIGEATFVSPVDSSVRRVVAYSGLIPAYAITLIGHLSPTLEHLGDGYTIILNPRRIRPSGSDDTTAVLHEVTHAVDPLFDEDCQKNPRKLGEHKDGEGYDLPNEQRAFTAMWTYDLREWLAAGEPVKPGALKILLRDASRFFGAFVNYAQCRDHELYGQIDEHFRQIVADLKARRNTTAHVDQAVGDK